MQNHYLAVKTKLGKTVATGGSVDELIANLVAKIEIQEERLANLGNAMVDIEFMEPDISATAPEHVAVYSAGWKAGRDASKNAVMRKVMETE